MVSGDRQECADVCVCVFVSCVRQRRNPDMMLLNSFQSSPGLLGGLSGDGFDEFVAASPYVGVRFSQ